MFVNWFKIDKGLSIFVFELGHVFDRIILLIFVFEFRQVFLIQ